MEQQTSHATNALTLNAINKWYDTDTARLPVLDNLSLHVAYGEFVTIIGHSGCGKSTLFGIIAGIERPDSGTIMVDGEEGDSKRGRVAYMPQRDALLPWYSVLENAILPARIQRRDKHHARQEAELLLDTFGLTSFGDALPAALSGGMRQRAALLRTFLWHRPVMLLDEPFGALDAITRAHMQQWLLSIWQQLHRTILLVTHDVDEAILLSDRVYVMSPRPGTIAHEMSIPLERPRSLALMTHPHYSALKAELLQTLGTLPYQPMHETA